MMRRISRTIAPINQLNKPLNISQCCMTNARSLLYLREFLFMAYEGDGSSFETMILFFIPNLSFRKRAIN